MRHLSVALAAIASAALFSWAAAPAQAALPGANGRLAFDSAGNIYTVKAEGTRLLKLTSDGESSGPAWSPSGKRIAFSRRGFIFVMTAQGRFPRKIERLGHSSEPAWSPTGKRLVFTHQGNIWAVRAGGGSPVQLTHDGVAPDYCTADSQPTWSPRGGTIAFTEANGVPGDQGGCAFHPSNPAQVVVLRLKGGTKHAISDASGADFTADGLGLVFASDEDPVGGSLAGTQYESSDLLGGHRAAYSRDFCAEGAPCLFGDVAAAPTSTLAAPQGVYARTFEGAEVGTFGGFCITSVAGLASGFCQ